MGCITMIRQRNRWKQVVGASLTIALLSAVAAVGLTLFGSELLAAWKTSGNPEQVLTSHGAFGGLLNFQAPAATAARFAAETQKAQDNIQKAGEAPLLVKNWKYTQNPVIDFLLSLYPQGIQLQLFTLLIERLFPNSPISAFAITFTIAWIKTADGFLGLFHLPPIPLASPSF